MFAHALQVVRVSVLIADQAAAGDVDDVVNLVNDHRAANETELTFFVAVDDASADLGRYAALTPCHLEAWAEVVDGGLGERFSVLRVPGGVNLVQEFAQDPFGEALAY